MIISIEFIMLNPNITIQYFIKPSKLVKHKDFVLS